MMKWPATLIFTAAALALGGCEGLYGDDELARYMQRSDKIALSAGDAKEVNAVTHRIHPWPRGVGDPRIAANGARMLRAIDRYQRSPGSLDGLSKAVGPGVGAPRDPETASPVSGSAPASSGAPAAPGGQ
jgi:hypothetical protein